MKIARHHDSEQPLILTPDGAVQRTVQLQIQNNHANPLPLQSLYQEVHPHGLRLFNTTDTEGYIDCDLILQDIHNTCNLVIITILSGGKPIDAGEIAIPLSPAVQFQRLLDHPDKKAIISFINQHGLEDVRKVSDLQEIYQVYEEKKDQQLLSEAMGTIFSPLTVTQIQLRKLYRQLFPL